MSHWQADSEARTSPRSESISYLRDLDLLARDKSRHHDTSASARNVACSSLRDSDSSCSMMSSHTDLESSASERVAACSRDSDSESDSRGMKPRHHLESSDSTS